MPECQALSDNLKQVRQIMKLSQIDFAASCGISVEILSLIERQKTDPKLSTIQKIAAYIGCEVVDLLKPKGVQLMGYTYKLREDVIENEDGQSFQVYGVTVSNNVSGETEETYPDIFFDKTQAESFVTFCNSEELDISRLPDAIEDILP